MNRLTLYFFSSASLISFVPRVHIDSSFVAEALTVFDYDCDCDCDCDCDYDYYDYDYYYDYDDDD